MLLLRAFKLIKDEIDSRLLILGSGDQKYELEQAISSLDLQKDVLIRLPALIQDLDEACFGFM